MSDDLAEARLVADKLERDAHSGLVGSPSVGERMIDAVHRLRSFAVIVEAYRACRVVDGLRGRTWDATEQAAAEGLLHALGEPGSTTWHIAREIMAMRSER